MVQNVGNVGSKNEQKIVNLKENGGIWRKMVGNLCKIMKNKPKIGEGPGESSGTKCDETKELRCQVKKKYIYI